MNSQKRLTFITNNCNKYFSQRPLVVRNYNYRPLLTFFVTFLIIYLLEEGVCKDDNNKVERKPHSQIFTIALHRGKYPFLEYLFYTSYKVCNLLHKNASGKTKPLQKLLRSMFIWNNQMDA